MQKISNFIDFIISPQSSLAEAIEKIDKNKSGIVFISSHDGRLIGSLTDGDIRRGLIGTSSVDLKSMAMTFANLGVFSLPVEIEVSKLEASFTGGINHIPLINSAGRIISIACKSINRIFIGNHEISNEKPSFLIAEIGNNHNGSLDLAITLIKEAALAGADCIKFQMRDLKEMYAPNFNKAGSDDLGAEYTDDLLQKFQLKNEELFSAFDYCKSLGVVPMCTPWDLRSLEKLEAYGIDAYKVASADLTNHELLIAICKTGKPIICSTGMSSEGEILEAAKIFQEQNSQYILLHCNSTYPAPYSSLNLKYIDRLKNISGAKIVGYSGHERGFHVPIAAVALGAKIIEKHFTIDRSMEGNDHKVSLLPNEFKEMVIQIRQIEEGMGDGQARSMSQGEIMNREVLGKSIVAKEFIPMGKIIEFKDLTFKSPGRGLSPYLAKVLVGRASRKEFNIGDMFHLSDLEEDRISPRTYTFARPFGIPVRYHDLQNLYKVSNFDLIEFHMSYRDMDLNPKDYLKGKMKIDLVVHCPELFKGDHILDLTSNDPSYRQRSLQEMQKVINISLELSEYFQSQGAIKIVTNIGGATQDKFMDKQARSESYFRLRESLNSLELTGVEIIPQTMPPYPWHFGGQRFHNLFVCPEEIKNFCSETGTRICLDISHSKLAANHLNMEFEDFIAMVGGHVAHMHISDSRGVDGEGLQIGDGEIDFKKISSILSKFSPRSSFIPEVWQGHKDGGRGFWIALEKLEGVL